MEVITAMAEGAQGIDTLFLGGGISGCPDWQSEMILEWQEAGLRARVFNPRRATFDVNDPLQSELQIKWEYRHLRRAFGLLFWFPEESICPITLFELGAWAMTDKMLFVGVHPNYSRRKDVEVQLGLVRPDVKIVYTPGTLAGQVLDAYGYDDRG